MEVALLQAENIRQQLAHAVRQLGRRSTRRDRLRGGMQSGEVGRLLTGPRMLATPPHGELGDPDADNEQQQRRLDVRPREVIEKCSYGLVRKKSNQIPAEIAASHPPSRLPSEATATIPATSTKAASVLAKLCRNGTSTAHSAGGPNTPANTATPIHGLPSARGVEAEGVFVWLQPSLVTRQASERPSTRSRRRPCDLAARSTHVSE
jgi:hypothetical protein